MASRAVAVIVLLHVIYVSGNGPLVSLKQGRYQGNYVRSRPYMEEYLGIPFAKPPVGDLRLANPEPVDENPNEMFNAKEYAAACPQVIDTVFGNFSGATMWNPPNNLMSEDCLYLNIWVPKRTPGRQYTVMVWIYGGGFFSGASSLSFYNGQTLASTGTVVVVSISYRLGALGFLSTGDSRLPGNFGLMDQVMALTWIKDNIEKFQGDPNKITLFGESSGAVSVLYHILSPLSSGLFQRAILQSHAGDDLIFQDKALASRNARALLDRLSCDSTDMMKCLRRQHFSTFLREQFTISETFRFAFQPTISDFMPRHPKELLEEGKFERKDVLLGVNRNEATYFMIYRLKSVSLHDQVSGQTQDDVKSAIAVYCPDADEKERQEIFDFYTKGIEATDKAGNRDAIDNIMGDRYFKCPSNHVAYNIARHGGNAYFYYYNHRASNEVWPKWMGVMHSAEIPFVFGMPLDRRQGYSSQEERFSTRVMSYFLNFARTGNPNNQGNTPWPRYTPDRKKYLELSLSEQKHDGGYREQQCMFWDSLLRSGAGGQSVPFFLVTLTSVTAWTLHHV